MTLNADSIPLPPLLFLNVLKTTPRMAVSSFIEFVHKIIIKGITHCSADLLSLNVLVLMFQRAFGSTFTFANVTKMDICSFQKLDAFIEVTCRFGGSIVRIWKIFLRIGYGCGPSYSSVSMSLGPLDRGSLY